MPYPELLSILEALHDNDPTGFCTACGAPVHDVQPYEEHTECPYCGSMAVYGAAQCLLTRRCQ